MHSMCVLYVFHESVVFYVSYVLCKFFCFMLILIVFQNYSFPNTRSKYRFGFIAPFVLEMISNYDSAKLYAFNLDPSLFTMIFNYPRV